MATKTCSARASEAAELPHHMMRQPSAATRRLATQSGFHSGRGTPYTMRSIESFLNRGAWQMAKRHHKADYGDGPSTKMLKMVHWRAAPVLRPVKSPFAAVLPRAEAES